MPPKGKGYYIRVANMQRIAREHYEPGRQDRCYKWVWRKYIVPMYGVSYITFMQSLKVDIPEEPKEDAQDRRQLSLFDAPP